MMGYDFILMQDKVKSLYFSLGKEAICFPDLHNHETSESRETVLQPHLKP